MRVLWTLRRQASHHAAFSVTPRLHSDLGRHSNSHSRWCLPGGTLGWGVGSLLATGIAGGAYYMSAFGFPTQGADAVPLEVRPATDELFDNTDNLCIFFFANPNAPLELRHIVAEHVSLIKNLELPFEVSFLQNVTSPAVDRVEGGHVTFYKGQRRLRFPLGQEPKDKEADIREFFAPVSEVPAPADEVVVEHVTFYNFNEKVVEMSSVEHPVLLQMFEDTCFLCCLMRPFINSLNDLFVKTGVPLTIKRLNIDRNDFPAGCPVTRGTPSFVLFRGPEEAPIKWPEFRPSCLVGKLKETVTFDENTEAQIAELLGQVQQRFQSFGLLSMWIQELSHLQTMLMGENLPSTIEDKEGSSPEGRQYNDVVMRIIEEDMTRTDCLNENLHSLRMESALMEKDCLSTSLSVAKQLVEFQANLRPHEVPRPTSEHTLDTSVEALEVAPTQ